MHKAFDFTGNRIHENRRLKAEFLREYETEFKKAFARESGGKGGLLDEKAEVRILVTLPFYTDKDIQHSVRNVYGIVQTVTNGF
jgi:hypothetical protein